MDIEKNLNTISKKLSNYYANLIPVIKNRTVEEVKEVYNCGFREFGENRLDDYFLHSDKFDDAVFHFIAPIQSRKIKVIFENFESSKAQSKAESPPPKIEIFLFLKLSLFLTV